MPTDARSIVIDSHTSNRDNIGCEKQLNLSLGNQPFPLLYQGV